MVTLTDMDEENLIVSMYANHLGVPKVVTKINRTEYPIQKDVIEVFIQPVRGGDNNDRIVQFDRKPSPGLPPPAQAF